MVKLKKNKINKNPDINRKTTTCQLMGLLNVQARKEKVRGKKLRLE
jgi:hypothetical protein